MKNIEDLLNRYFEGGTSAEEERRLRAFFASGEVPGHLAEYIPLFAYFEEEIKKDKTEISSETEIRFVKFRNHSGGRTGIRRACLYIASGVAVSLLLLLVIGRILNPAETLFCSGNYVVINGHCYTDIHKVRSLAFEALQEVATPADLYFPEAGSGISDREIIDNQLKELGSVFSDDE